MKYIRVELIDIILGIILFFAIMVAAFSWKDDESTDDEDIRQTNEMINYQETQGIEVIVFE